MAEHVETRAANRGGRGKCVAAVLALLVIGLGCGARPEAPEEKPSRRSVPSKSSAREARRVREPAVAGLFYPGEAKKLSGMIDALLASAPDHSIPG